MLTSKMIFQNLTNDQLYTMAIQLSSYSLNQQLDTMISCINERCDAETAAMIQNVKDCSKLGSEYPKPLNLMAIMQTAVDERELVELIAVMPVHIFFDLELMLIENDAVSLAELQHLIQIKSLFVKQKKEVLT